MCIHIIECLGRICQYQRSKLLKNKQCHLNSHTFDLRIFNKFARIHKVRMIKRYSREKISKIWSEENKYKVWLDLELAVCEAHAELGNIPKQALEQIKEKAAFDISRIEELDKKLHHDVLAFLTCISESVDTENSSEKLSSYIHLGMTSSDLIDTSLSILISQSTNLIEEGLDKFLAVLKAKAEEHKNTICMGRSHGIHAEPTTFGLKLLGYYDELIRAKQDLGLIAKESKVGMISGAVGTFANINPKIEEIVCSKLGLEPALVTTQVIGRDRHARLLNSLATIASSIERISIEIRHLQRTEVLEVEEPFVQGQKGSSAMPHKRNPWRCENLSGLARMMRSYAGVGLENIVLWHERDISHSSTERIMMPDAFMLLDFMLDRIAWIIEGLNVYPENMKANMNKFGGVSFSQQVLLKLVNKGLSREEAYAIVQGLAHQAWNKLDGDFYKLVTDSKEVNKHLSKQELEECFDPSHHLSNVDYIFDRVLNQKVEG